MFDFKRATVFCLGYRLSKPKITRYSKYLGEAMAPGYVHAIGTIYVTKTIALKATERLRYVLSDLEQQSTLTSASTVWFPKWAVPPPWGKQKWAIGDPVNNNISFVLLTLSEQMS